MVQHSSLNVVTRCNISWLFPTIQDTATLANPKTVKYVKEELGIQFQTIKICGLQCCRSSTCFYLTYIQYCVQQFTHCVQCGTVLSLNAAISHYLLSFFHSINFEFLMTWVHFYHKRNSGGGGNIPYILLRDGPFYFSFFFWGGGRGGGVGQFF